MTTTTTNIYLKATDRASGVLRNVGSSVKAVSDTAKSAANSMRTFTDAANNLRSKLIPSFGETMNFQRAVREADQAMRLGAISATEYAQVISQL
jgi:methylaspartate ammonia-lyase